MLLDDGVLAECQPPRWKHALCGLFSSGFISIDGVRPLFQSCSLWAPSGRSCLTCLGYDNILGCAPRQYNTLWSTLGLFFLSAATEQPRLTHKVGHASKPTLSMGYLITLVYNVLVKPCSGRAPRWTWVDSRRIAPEHLPERFLLVNNLHPTRQWRNPHVHQLQQRARPPRCSLRQPDTGRGENRQG